MSGEAEPKSVRIKLSDRDAESREILDLYDLAVLLTYERWTLDPIYRHAKLVDYALKETDFLCVQPSIPEWHNAARAGQRHGFYFTKSESSSGKSERGVTAPLRDLPETMLAEPPPSGLQYFSPLQLETLFYQPRAVGSSVASVSLLGHLMRLFPPDQILRIRTAQGGAVYSRAGDLVGERYTLVEPGVLVLSIVRPSRSSGADDALVFAFGETAEAEHCVVSLPTRVGPGPSGISQPYVLDLSSLVFGDAGRPFGGRGLFALEPRLEYERRLGALAKDVWDPELLGRRVGVVAEEEAVLHEIAKRVKERYDRRLGEPWCGHCGAPNPENACGQCLTARFCSREHQGAAWPMHKHQCSSKGSA